jgi:hypothetical protein
MAVPRGVEPPIFGLGNRFGYQFINDLRPNVANVLHPSRREKIQRQLLMPHKQIAADGRHVQHKQNSNTFALIAI